MKLFVILQLHFEDYPLIIANAATIEKLFKERVSQLFSFDYKADIV
jgi:hypothetical protein